MSDDPSKSMRRPTDNAAGNSTTPDRPDSADGKVTEAIARVLKDAGTRPTDAPRVAQQVIMTLESFHSGPLPPARDFAAYEQICPGAARDILNMAKEEQRQRYEIERKDLNGAIFLNLVGML